MALTPLQRIVKVLGTVEQVAQFCGVTRSAVTQWQHNGIPRKHVLPLEERTRSTDYPVTAREMLEWDPKREKAAA